MTSLNSGKKCFSKRIAFTLAEVLVTLAIIGVTAALTIPSLIQSVETQQYKVAWKKNFASFSQVTQLILQDHNGTFQALCSGTENHNCLKDLYLPYLSYVKACPENNNQGYCWHNNPNVTYLDGTPIPFGDDDAGAILSNGTLIDFFHSDVNCNYNPWANTAICGAIFVDVNGFKKPNKMGIDVFGFLILTDRIKPFGSGDAFDGLCEGSTGDSSGNGCSAKYIFQ